jgi:hypothetical protein
MINGSLVHRTNQSRYMTLHTHKLLLLLLLLIISCVPINTRRRWEDNIRMDLKVSNGCIWLRTGTSGEFL